MADRQLLIKWFVPHLATIDTQNGLCRPRIRRLLTPRYHNEVPIYCPNPDIFVKRVGALHRSNGQVVTMPGITQVKLLNLTQCCGSAYEFWAVRREKGLPRIVQRYAGMASYAYLNMLMPLHKKLCPYLLHRKGITSAYHPVQMLLRNEVMLYHENRRRKREAAVNKEKEQV